MSFDLARKVADAVLYEGYMLYPYRPSTVKNQFRWQFGVIAPQCWSEFGGEPWEMQTEVLVEPQASPVLDVIVRFLRIQPRVTEDGTPWDDGVERSVEFSNIALDALLDQPQGRPLGEADLDGCIELSAERVDGFYKVRLRVENRTSIDAGVPRNVALQHSLAGAHTLFRIDGGLFVTLTDPPAEARAAAASCINHRAWPVLIGQEGERNVMLSSPIILGDYPTIAPESPGDLFDATEIDEILTLRVMTLTDEEKREACATDDRARRIIVRSDTIPPEIFERLHGAIRGMGAVNTEAFFNPPDERPEEAFVEIANQRVGKGARVRLAPKRQSDAMDFFLAGRMARVEAIHHDVEDRIYIAVSIEDDPAAGLLGAYGRFYYYYPDEIEVMEVI